LQTRPPPSDRRSSIDFLVRTEETNSSDSSNSSELFDFHESYTYHYDDDCEEHDVRDESEVLGESVTRGTSEDLVNMIYQPFQSCTSTFNDGSCCGTSACHCGPSCVCKGCTIRSCTSGNERHATASNSEDDDKDRSGCCRIDIKELIHPEHSVIIDEDGVTLCGCGCRKPNSECSDCVASLCEGN
jgi:hypothetical protein